MGTWLSNVQKNQTNESLSIGPQAILDTMFSGPWQYIHFSLIMTVTLSSAASQACLLGLSSLSIKFYFITASHMHLICSLLYIAAAI